MNVFFAGGDRLHLDVTGLWCIRYMLYVTLYMLYVIRYMLYVIHRLVTLVFESKKVSSGMVFGLLV